MVTQPNGYVNERSESEGQWSRMKARIPFFRQKLKIVEPITGSFLKVCTYVPGQPWT